MPIVGVTASYALYACPYACRAFFTIPAAALNKTAGVQEIPLTSKALKSEASAVSSGPRSLTLTHSLHMEVSNS